MTIRLGINGFGRMGAMLRAVMKNRNDIEVVAISISVVLKPMLICCDMTVFMVVSSIRLLLQIRQWMLVKAPCASPAPET